MAKRVFVEFYGQRAPQHQKVASFCKSDLAQDGCTVLCHAKKCYNLGIHRCAACEMASYCSEICRATDRPRHHEKCKDQTIVERIAIMRRFRNSRPKAICQGRPFCKESVQSFCRYCLAPTCDDWICAKYHLEHCHEYSEFLSNDWVMVEHAEAPIENDS